MSRRLHGAEHPQTLYVMTMLAGLRGRQGRLDEALDIIDRTLEIRKRVSGPRHASTFIVMEGKAQIFYHCGEPERRMHREH